jgi:hypothetical protein
MSLTPDLAISARFCIESRGIRSPSTTVKVTLLIDALLAEGRIAIGAAIVEQYSAA